MQQKMLRECKNIVSDTAVSTVKPMHSTTENFFGDEMFHSGGKCLHTFLSRNFLIMIL